MDAVGAEQLTQEPNEIDDAVAAEVLRKEAMFEQKPPMLQLEVVSYGKVVLVNGNIEPIKDTLKELGGMWQNKLQSWQYPSSQHARIVQRLKTDGHTSDDRFQKFATMLQLEVVSYGQHVLVKGNTKPIQSTFRELGCSRHRKRQSLQY